MSWEGGNIGRTSGTAHPRALGLGLAGLILWRHPAMLSLYQIWENAPPPFRPLAVSVLTLPDALVPLLSQSPSRPRASATGASAPMIHGGPAPCPSSAAGVAARLSLTGRNADGRAALWSRLRPTVEVGAQVPSLWALGARQAADERRCQINPFLPAPPHCRRLLGGR